MLFKSLVFAIDECAPHAPSQEHVVGVPDKGLGLLPLQERHGPGRCCGPTVPIYGSGAEQFLVTSGLHERLIFYEDKTSVITQDMPLW